MTPVANHRSDTTDLLEALAYGRCLVHLLDQIVIPRDLLIEQGKSLLHVTHHCSGQSCQLVVLVIDNRGKLRPHFERCLRNNHTVFSQQASNLIDLRDAVSKLQRRAKTSVSMRVKAAAVECPDHLYVFDILAKGKRDLRASPRRTQGHPSQVLREHTASRVTGIDMAGAWVSSQAQSLDFERMVAKRLQSTYQRGSSRGWVKIKSDTYSRKAALGFGHAAKDT